LLAVGAEPDGQTGPGAVLEPASRPSGGRVPANDRGVHRRRDEARAVRAEDYVADRVGVPPQHAAVLPQVPQADDPVRRRTRPPRKTTGACRPGSRPGPGPALRGRARPPGIPRPPRPTRGASGPPTT